MDIKETRRKRLQEWFENRTLPAKDKSYISQIITGKSSLGEKGASRLEKEYGMPVGYLSGEEYKEHSNVSNIQQYTKGTRYPVLSKVQAGTWAEAVEAYTLKDIDIWLESDAHIQGDAFWLEVEGDSMTAPMGLSIPEGTFVLFDTGRDAVNGNLVVAKLQDDNEATFKKLIVDGSQRYLKGLNPQWPLVPINGNCTIIGVAVETKMRLL
ncbi:LexA family transcriptional repressor [Raoultella sp. Lac2]|nr:LexA family transcriptional repressor [Raoultella sp. Lac2]MXF99261.1 LexA family transcriptional repressor [Raoultella sp. Lac1]